MKLKDSSVKIKQNEYTDAIKQAVEKAYSAVELEPTITSGNDSQHGAGSYHYTDRALDFRFWDLLEVYKNKIKEHLPPFYDVIVEKDHFHIEADKTKEAQWITQQKKKAKVKDGSGNPGVF